MFQQLGTKAPLEGILIQTTIAKNVMVDLRGVTGWINIKVHCVEFSKKLIKYLKYRYFICKPFLDSRICQKAQRLKWKSSNS